METIFCSQCKKEIKRNGLRIYCSEACRKAGYRARSIKHSASIARKKMATERKETIAKEHLFHRVGEYVRFSGETGKIIARVETGETIGSVWEKLLEEDPTLYDARVGIPPKKPVSGVRYILSIEKRNGVHVRWPYTYFVKGVDDGSQEKSSSEESREGTERREAEKAEE